jgi:hypothetical protein
VAAFVDRQPVGVRSGDLDLRPHKQPARVGTPQLARRARWSAQRRPESSLLVPDAWRRCARKTLDREAIDDESRDPLDAGGSPRSVNGLGFRVIEPET